MMSQCLHGYDRLLLLLLLIILTFGGLSQADFTNSFSNVKAGLNLTLTWDSVPQEYSPFYITAHLINRSADGLEATGYKANITSKPPQLPIFFFINMVGGHKENSH